MAAYTVAFIADNTIVIRVKRMAIIRTLPDTNLANNTPVEVSFDPKF
jgi:hypothetical protein